MELDHTQTTLFGTLIVWWRTAKYFVCHIDHFLINFYDKIDLHADVYTSNGKVRGFRSVPLFSDLFHALKCAYASSGTGLDDEQHVAEWEIHGEIWV